MREITRQLARVYSRLGQRGAIFGMAINDAYALDNDLVVMTADLATLSGMERYVKTVAPYRFINAGIAEQNLVGMAAGLAAEGLHPVVTTYATFLTMRACEQIRHFMGYMSLPIIAIGSGAGLSQGFAGNTHYTIEDISMMRAIPNIKIFSPADAASAVKLFELSLETREPIYMRLTGGMNMPMVYTEDVSFRFGGSNIIREGKDISILATGTMVFHAVQVADVLQERGISVQVVDMYSIKPIDSQLIAQVMNKGLIVTLEEHSKIGGLGAAVAEEISNLPHQCRLLRLGISDRFDLAGDYEFLLSQNRLMPEQIVEDIMNVWDELD
jgi:transketolase